jgi:DNA-binding SARP family transcriptional activator
VRRRQQKHVQQPVIPHPSTDSATPGTEGIEGRLLSEVVALRRQMAALSDGLLRPRPVPHGPSQADLPEPSPAPIADLYATFFGTFALYRGQRQLPLGHNRAVVELCRYLIARAGQLIPQDELLELLWPNSDSVPARHRLHVAVSSMRRILEVDGDNATFVQLDDQCYSIPAHAVVTDCDLFERHYQDGKLCLARRDLPSAAAAFRAALALYKGEYLANLPYAAWTHQARAHFAERRLTALTVLCEHAALEHDVLAVLEYAQQILEIDNLRERAHRHLMRAHYHLGQRGCALRQYQTCARILHEELGVPPAQVTQRLRQAICDDADLPPETPTRL